MKIQIYQKDKLIVDLFSFWWNISLQMSPSFYKNIPWSTNSFSMSPATEVSVP